MVQKKGTLKKKVNKKLQKKLTKSITGGYNKKAQDAKGDEGVCRPADSYTTEEDCGPNSKSKKKCADTFTGSCGADPKDTNGKDCADFADEYNECKDDNKYKGCSADGFNEGYTYCKNGKDRKGKPCRKADSYNPDGADGKHPHCKNGKDDKGRPCRSADSMSDTCEGCGCKTNTAAAKKSSRV